MLRDAASDAAKTSEAKKSAGDDAMTAARATAAATAAATAFPVDAEAADPDGASVAYVEPAEPVSAATDETYDFWGSMVWCLIGGVLSSMLQFAFVFGGGLVDVARAKGVPDAAAAMLSGCYVFSSTPSDTAATRRDCSSSTARGVGSERRRGQRLSTPRACAR